MRRSTVNVNVLKAMTIGIAAVLTTTSVPMNAYAAENDPIDPAGSSESEGQSSEDTISLSEAVADCDAAEETAETASEYIETAVDAVNDIEASEITAQEDIDAVIDDLNAGSEAVAEAKTATEKAEDALSDVTDILDKEDSDYNAALNTANAAMNGLKDKDGNTVKAEDKIAEYDAADKTGTENSDSVIAKADIANTSDDEKEAVKAKDEAESELAVAEEALVVAVTAYDEASEAVDTASAQYDKAVEEKAKADEALAKAKEQIVIADTNAIAAHERLKAAQSKVDALAGKVETLKKNKESLESLKSDYYNFMVHYYRDGAIGSAVYDKDGNLDIEASAKKAVESGKVKNHPSVTEKTYSLARDLMKKIIYLELTSNGVDPDTIRYAEEEKGLSKKQAAEGDLVKDDKGNARVTINENSKYNIWMDYNTSGEDGRYHSVKVTYTVMVDGEEQEVTKYYNDIFKTDKYDKYENGEANLADMQNGPIYIGEITKENGKAVSYSRDQDDFNFDNYGKILEAINALENIKEYEEAQKAVADAASEVDKLQSEIENLSKVAVDSSKIDELGERLEAAKQTLKETSAKKQALEGKVEEARKAFEGIDLSRFVKPASPAVTPDTPEIADDTDDGADTPDVIPTIVTGGPAATVPQINVIPAGGAAAVAAIADEEVPLAGSVETQTVVEKDNETNQFKSEEKVDEDTVKIEDNDVPLATMPAENEVKMNWWWLLLIAVLGATGKALYEEHKKKVQVETVEEDSEN